MFFLEQSATLEIEVHDQHYSYELEKGHQELPILGLKADKDNEVKMRVIYKDGTQIISTLNIKTPPLPERYPEIDLRVSNKVQMEKGLFSLSLGRSEGVKTIEALYSIVDEAGELGEKILIMGPDGTYNIYENELYGMENMRDSIYHLPEHLFLTARTWGLTRKQRVCSFIIPAAMPSIFTSLKIVLGSSMVAVFFAENYATRVGIGYYIMNAWIKVDYVEMYSGIVAISLCGMGLFKLIEWVERQVCKWKVVPKREDI